MCASSALSLSHFKLAERHVVMRRMALGAFRHLAEDR